MNNTEDRDIFDEATIEAEETDDTTSQDKSESLETSEKDNEGDSDEPENSDESDEEPHKESSHELKLRTMVIDSLEEKLKAVDDGTASKADLIKYFKNNPEQAQIANRSKRVKDGYRSLMKKADSLPEDTKEKDEKKSISQQIREAMQEVKNDETERSLRASREETARSFGEKLGLKDESYSKFVNRANAIFSADEDIDYSQALKEAARAIGKAKPSPVDLSTTSSGGQDTVDESGDVNLAEGYALDMD